MSCYIMYGGVTWKSAVLKVAIEVTKVYVYRPLLETVREKDLNDVIFKHLRCHFIRKTYCEGTYFFSVSL